MRLRGRPPKQSAFGDRHEVLEVFHEVGPHVGLPTLRGAFPIMPRGELIDLQAAYRRHYRATHRWSVEELDWSSPGRVWAMDHTEPPAPVDGCYPRILAVRDLASGMQLAWLPVMDEKAEPTEAALRMLFTLHGAPLVLKSDNGSAFISHVLHSLLDRWQVVPLFSPPRMPEYNGACEAGIGAMQVRTFSLAAQAGRCVLWTSEDLEAARQQANTFYRPGSHRGPTRSACWALRLPITPDERAAFALSLARCSQRVRDSLTGLPAHGNACEAASSAHGNTQMVDACVSEDQADRQPVHSDALPLADVPGAALHGASTEALIHRRAVRQALVEQGLLSITRRSIPLPIKFFRAAKIM
jgi:transposase InsO family protein